MFDVCLFVRCAVGLFCVNLYFWYFEVSCDGRDVRPRDLVESLCLLVRASRCIHSRAEVSRSDRISSNSHNRRRPLVITGCTEGRRRVDVLEVHLRSRDISGPAGAYQAPDFLSFRD